MPTRIAIVGCGAVANAHLPIIAESDASETTVLVDKSLERAREMAEANGVEHVLDDYEKVAGLADAAVVALPHHLHARASIALLERGVHVLVEKPMGMTVAECDAMIAASEKGGAHLAAGLTSRYLAVAKYVKRLLEADVIGSVRSFDVREGVIYDWPVASDFMFRRDMGGGVLADTGAHVLDLLMYWLGDYANVAYRDDAAGGAEADCELDLELASGATGVVQLSRTRKLRNTWILNGERGTLEVVRRFDGDFRLTMSGESVALTGGFKTGDVPEDPLDAFRGQWADFMDAIATGRPPLVNGSEGKRSVALIEACHAQAGRIERAWEAFAR